MAEDNASLPQSAPANEFSARALQAIDKLADDFYGHFVEAQRVRQSTEHRSRLHRPLFPSIAASIPDPDQLRQQVETSNIAALLAQGPLELSRIRDYVAEPWRSIFLGPSPRNIETAVRLMAYNLDWYLEPPRQMFRGEWRVSLLYVGFVALLLILTLVRGSLTHIPWSLMMILPFYLQMAQRSYRRAVYVEVLYDYLHELLATPPELQPGRPEGNGGLAPQPKRD